MVHPTRYIPVVKSQALNCTIYRYIYQVLGIHVPQDRISGQDRISNTKNLKKKVPTGNEAQFLPQNACWLGPYHGLNSLPQAWKQNIFIKIDVFPLRVPGTCSKYGKTVCV